MLDKILDNPELLAGLVIVMCFGIMIAHLMIRMATDPSSEQMYADRLRAEKAEELRQKMLREANDDE